jgi:hypothetical protein
VSGYTDASSKFWRKRGVLPPPEDTPPADPQEWPWVAGPNEVPTESDPVDMVNSPPHYQADGVECIDAIRAALGPAGFADYCRGQVIKYVWRGPHKGAEVQDYRKAAWYLERLVNP